MALGAIIGRVAIKVLPDTTEFRDEAANDLSRIQKLLNPVEVKVIPELDKKSKDAVETELKAWAKGLDQIIKIGVVVDKNAINEATAELDKLDKEKTFSFSVDENSLTSVRDAITKLREKMVEELSEKVEINLDMDSLADELGRLRDIETTLPLELEIDKSSIASVKSALAAIEAELSRQSQVHMDVSLDTESLQAARKELTQLADELGRADRVGGGFGRTMSGIGIALSAMSGLNVVRTMFKSLREELMSIDLAVPKIGAVSHAVGVLGAMLLGTAGNLFSLSSSLASIGQVGLALPGMFAGIAIGLGVMVAALKDFNTMVPQATTYMHALQDIISQNFWEKAAAPIRNLVDKLFPILKTQLGETSTALGGFFAALANSTTNILLPSLAPMFGHLTDSINIATGFTDAFVGIIEKLGTVGAAYLPRLAQYIGEIGTQFDNWLGKMGTKKLTAWVDEGILALQDLGSVIASTFSILGSISAAATEAGGATLDSLAASLRGVAEAAQSPGFQKGLTATLKSAFDMLTQINTIAGPALKGLVVAMSQNFQQVAPIIGDTVGTAIDAIAKALAQPEVSQGLTSMFEGFNKMVHLLAPAMDPLMQKFAVMGELVGALAANIGGVMAAAIINLTPIFTSLASALIPVINMLGPMITGVIEALGPVFERMAKTAGKVGDALVPMAAAFQKLIDLIMPVLVPVLKVVVSILGDALVAVIDGVTWVIEGLVKVVSGVIDVFKGFGNIIAGLFTLDFGRMWDGLKQVFSGLGQILLGGLQAALGAVWAYLNGTVLGFFKSFVLKLVGPIVGPLSKFFKPLTDAAQKVWGVIKQVWDKITDIFTGGGGGAGIGAAITKPFEAVGSVISGVFNVIKSVVSTGWNVITTVFGAAGKVISTVVEAAFTVISTVIKAHITVIQTVVKAAWSAISTVFSTTLNVIKTVVTTVWTAISTVFSTVLNAIKTVVMTVWGAIRSFFQTSMDGLYFLFKEPWDTIAAFLFNTMETIKVGILMAWNSVRTFFTTLLDYFIVRFQLAWDAISSATSTVFNAIETVIKAVWNAIEAFITSTLKGIESVVKTVWNAIESAVTTVVNAIKSVVTSVWDAISSSTSSVFNSVKSTASSIWNGIKETISGVVNGIKSTVSGAWDSIKSTASSAWDSVKNTVTSAWGNVKSAVQTGVSNAKSEVEELPGKMVKALGNVGTMLLASGESIIQGLITGIENKAGNVAGAIRSVLKKARDLLPFSPAKVGPFSGMGWTLYSGRSIVTAMADGITEKTSVLTRALSDTLGKAQKIASGTTVSDTLVTSIATGITDGTADVVSAATSMAEVVSAELKKAFDQTLDLGVSAGLAGTEIRSTNLDRRLGGLERQVTSAARSQSSSSEKAAPATISIDNITIPLEDLAQLQDLEEFLDMLRVRTRQG